MLATVLQEAKNYLGRVLHEVRRLLDKTNPSSPDTFTDDELLHLLHTRATNVADAVYSLTQAWNRTLEKLLKKRPELTMEIFYQRELLPDCDVQQELEKIVDYGLAVCENEC